MRKAFKYLLPLLLAAASCTKTEPAAETTGSFEGLVINEVSPGKTMFTDAWIEIYNTTPSTIRLKGLKILLTTTQVVEEPVATLAGGEVAPGGYFVISSLETEFSSPMLLANFKEVAIADVDDYPVNAFSVEYDYHYSGRVAEGESYARIPDAKGEWVITKTPTPGAENYRVTPRTISGLVLNEVCPREKWVELVNTGKGDIQLEYSYLVGKSEAVLYSAPAGTIIPAGGRIAVDCEGGETEFSELKYCSNKDDVVASFNAGSLKTPPEGGSWSRLPDITGNFAVSTVSTKGEPNYSVSSSETGMVINEVAQGWVEVSNSTISNITTASMKLYGVKGGSETLLQTFSAKTFKSHGTAVVDVTVSGYDSFVLKASDGSTLDSFRKADVHDNLSLASGNSWSRIPDGVGNYYTVVTPTRDAANYGIQTGNTIAMWVNHSSMGSIDLEEMCRLGIGNIFIHEFVFRSDKHSISETKAFFDRAHSLGQKIHIWMQCFWWNDEDTWRCPVIDATASSPARYNQALFDEVIGRALSYLPYDIDGIHFDYVRFPGTASKHDFPSDGITGTGAITEFCRQASTKIRAKRSDIVLSAAMMGESAAVSYYGQDPEKMRPYIDVFMPMAYISSYGYSAAKNVSVANWFADRRGTSQVWHGISTYDSNTKGLSASEIYSDSKNIADNSRAQGIAFFRYGLGTIPDMNDIYKK